jgi:hypothetical protein
MLFNRLVGYSHKVINISFRDDLKQTVTNHIVFGTRDNLLFGSQIKILKVRYT